MPVHPVATDDVGSRATPAIPAINLMDILMARRKLKSVPVAPKTLGDVESTATPATPASELKETLRAEEKREHEPHGSANGGPKDAPITKADQELLLEQPATVGVLNTVPNAESTSPGLPVRLCLGCGNPFTPSDDNKVYCQAKCWNTPRAVLKPAG